MADATKFDMNAPAFGPGSQKIEPDIKKEESVVAEVTKVVEEAPKPEADAEESKVPYSRFKKFHDRALEAETEAAKWREIAEKKEPSVDKVESELPSFWVELYGDSDASKRAWKIQSEQNEALISKAREEAIEAVRNEKYEETERVEKNVEYIDSQFENLSALVGRDLTEKEQSAVLDIVDEYTPKDKDGNYSGDIIPIEKAWEVYELKQGISKAPKQASRDNVASLSGASTQGTPDARIEQDKSFNPLDWGAYKKRL